VRRSRSNCVVSRVARIIEIFLWVVLGALAGSLIGAYRSANADKPAPTLGNAVHLVVCVVVGAMVDDNALAETIIGLFKTEIIRRRGPWKSIEAVEFAVLQWVDWFNHRRLLESIGDVPPAEFEQAYYRQQEAQAIAA
jgi:hypothetical protein